MTTLNAKEAARLLGVSSRKMYELAAPAGPIRCYRIGKRVVFEEADLERFFQSCKVVPLPPIRVKLLASGQVTSATLRDLLASESPLEKACKNLGIASQPRNRKKGR